MSAVDGLGAAPTRCRPGPLEMLAGQGVQGDLLHAPSVADTLTGAAEPACPPAVVSGPARTSVISAAAASWALSCLVLRVPVSGGVSVPGRLGPVLIWDSQIVTAPGTVRRGARVRRSGVAGPRWGGVRREVSSRRRAWPARARRCGMTVARPDQRRRRSGSPGAGVASAGGRWWHDLPCQGAPSGDHDEFPVPGADREGPGVGLLENAQHVGHLLAVRRSWAPADHDPLADIGGGG